MNKNQNIIAGAEAPINAEADQSQPTPNRGLDLTQSLQGRLVLAATGLVAATAAGGVLMSHWSVSDALALNAGIRAHDDLSGASERAETFGLAPEILAPHLTDLAPASASGFIVVDALGRTVLEAGQTAGVSNALVKAAADQALTRSDEITLSGENHAIAARRLNVAGQDVALVVVNPHNATTKGLLARDFAWAGLLGLSSILGFLVMQMMARHGFAPLARLADQTRNLANNPNGERPNIEGALEVRQIADSVARMADQLELGADRLRRAALVDPVTELANRRQFLLAGAQVVADRRSGGLGALIIVDITRFRAINEALGRPIADEILAVAGERLTNAVRATDAAFRSQQPQFRPSVVARLGADEFGILVPEVADQAEGEQILRDVFAALCVPIEVDNRRLRIAACAGAAFLSRETHDGDAALREAMLALREAKSNGPGTIRIFDGMMDRRVKQAFELESLLRDAVEHQRIVPHFQPRVDLATGRVTGAEALARWIDPKRGRIDPGRFIPMAERLGLMGELGMQILRRSCREAANWRAGGLGARVSVNVSASQFEDHRFSEHVFAVLRDTGLPPDFLELEITETIATKDPGGLTKRLEPLRKAGVRFALDDFGTGYSSLAALTSLPIDVCKIDRSFVKGIEVDPQSTAVVETILTLAKALKFETVAEGIELVQQEVYLRRRGCETGQGFLYGAAMPAEEFVSVVKLGRNRALKAV